MTNKAASSLAFSGSSLFQSRGTFNKKWTFFLLASRLAEDILCIGSKSFPSACCMRTLANCLPPESEKNISHFQVCGEEVLNSVFLKKPTFLLLNQPNRCFHSTSIGCDHTSSRFQPPASSSSGTNYDSVTNSAGQSAGGFFVTRRWLVFVIFMIILRVASDFGGKFPGGFLKDTFCNSKSLQSYWSSVALSSSWHINPNRKSSDHLPDVGQHHFCRIPKDADVHIQVTVTVC